MVLLTFKASAPSPKLLRGHSMTAGNPGNFNYPLVNIQEAMENHHFKM
jgi:hypothetical protein